MGMHYHLQQRTVPLYLPPSMTFFKALSREPRRGGGPGKGLQRPPPPPAQANFPPPFATPQTFAVLSCEKHLVRGCLTGIGGSRCFFWGGGGLGGGFPCNPHHSTPSVSEVTTKQGPKVFLSKVVKNQWFAMSHPSDTQASVMC